MSDRRRAGGGLVYSTEGGRMCPACRRPLADCGRQAAAAAAAAPKGDGIVRVGRETAGRGGKGVTVVRGLALDATALTELARRLKAHCGCGGTAKDGTIEIQGEQRDAVVAFLQREGWKVRRSGG
ncbi:MAG: translation initiation factor Sui1 [Comamonadaceae bacterium]|nr:translation initiation factor Sui1 [Comamonadaceae bacterium]